ncbi:MAG: hypothetical protein HOP11_07090 [Saprospiraceae bacterium]|nr:hypothetical protein [Saprospiraceae bacterium]
MNLQEECGGPSFLEGMSLCITYTCYGPNGGVPQTSTVCKTIYEGIACGYPSQGIDCILSFRIPGLYASVTGSLNGTVTVKRWLAPSILLDDNNLDSRIVFYEPDPADSYYNYSYQI